MTVHGAGRTDAGVHALAQVASVSVSSSHDTQAFCRGLNAVLPPAVRIIEVVEAEPGFPCALQRGGEGVRIPHRERAVRVALPASLRVARAHALERGRDTPGVRVADGHARFRRVSGHPRGGAQHLPYGDVAVLERGNPRSTVRSSCASKGMDFSGTWCATSSGRSSKWAPAAGRHRGSRRFLRRAIAARRARQRRRAGCF